jgi:cytochrome c oxidase subunit 4
MAEHIVPPRVYVVIYLSLLALTVLTTSLSFVNLGAYHTIVGIIIASCKAALVFLFFMHLLYSTRLTWVIVLGALFWLGIILVLTMSDYWTRHLLTTA